MAGKKSKNVKKQPNEMGKKMKQLQTAEIEKTAITKNKKQKDPYAFSRFMYILEAAFEYFISIIIADAYLAKLGTAVGLSDAVIGILSSFVSLGCGMQIVAVFIRGRISAKKFVSIGNVINQSLYALMYLTPFFPIPTQYRSVFLIAFLLVGQLIMNVIQSHKVNWFMSLVDDHKRGVFTANKEIISLIGGMLFTFAMGAISDYFEKIGNETAFFITAAVAVFALTALHTATLLLSKEKPQERTEVKDTSFRSLLLNKNLVKVILFSVLWHVVNYAAIPFYGAYKVNTLGFNMTLVAVLSAVGSIVRAVASRPMGRFADRHSFATCLILCFSVLLAGFSLNIFAVPANGVVIFTGYIVLNAVAMAGINSGTINLVYDYVSHERRVAALALQNSIAGVAGFLTTLAVSPLVEYIQKNGNVFLGIHAYPQQVLSFFSAIGTVLVILYLIFVIRPMRREESSD